MKFFVDSADLEQIRDIHSWFPLDGVTTNPSLVSKSGQEHHQLICSVCEIVKGGMISAEVLAVDSAGMLKEARTLAGLHPQVVVKLPLTKEGLIACYQLSKENIKTNLTLCFSPLQALLAARAGASMVSVFVGRLDDIGAEGMSVVEQVLQIFSNYNLNTKVLTASVRNISHILMSAEMGADIITIPPKLFPLLVQHPLTKTGLAQFLKDAKKTPVK